VHVYLQFQLLEERLDRRLAKWFLEQIIHP